MYVSIEHTTHPVSSAAFFGLECAAYATQIEDLAARRAAWLKLRSPEELASLGVPVPISDSSSPRYFALAG